MATVEITGKGREALWLRGSEADVAALVAREASAAARRPDKTWVLSAPGLRLRHVGWPSNGALLFEALPPRNPASVVAHFASLPDTPTLAQAVAGEQSQWAPIPEMTELMREALDVGASDVSVVRAVASLPQRKLRRAIVFVCGMLGQDVADRAGEILGEGRVFPEDIPKRVEHMLHRYVGQHDHLTRFVLLLAEVVPPLENVSIHLAVR